MKRISFFFLTVLYLATAPACFAQTPVISGSAGNDSAAVAVMDQYFVALANGNSIALKTLLGGDLLEKRKRLLGNPAYSGYLRKLYANAGFTILSYQSNSPDSVTIEALIIFGENETVRKSYQLKRPQSNTQGPSFVIVGENTIAGPL